MDHRGLPSRETFQAWWPQGFPLDWVHRLLAAFTTNQVMSRSQGNVAVDPCVSKG